MTSTRGDSGYRLRIVLCDDSVTLGEAVTLTASSRLRRTPATVTGAGLSRYVTDLCPERRSADLDGIATDLTIDLEATSVALAADDGSDVLAVAAG